VSERWILGALVVAMLAGCSGLGGDFYVAPGGHDANPGTKAKPFVTLARARDAVREKIARGMTGDIVVEFAAGTYFIREGVRFDDRDGGRDGHWVIYRGAPNGETTIYGGVPVTGWEKWKGHVYRARVEPAKRFYRLFENGRGAIMARHPNKGDGYGGGVTRASDTEVRIPEAWLNYDFADALVFGWLGQNWVSMMGPVTGLDKAKRTLQIKPGGGGINERLYVRGVLELLDEPGEWYLKSKEGHLYYWPRGEPIEKQLIVRPAARRVLDVRGRSMQSPARNLRFEGIDFIGSDSREMWRPFAPEEGEAMIHIENAEQIEVRSCRILGAGHSAVALVGYAKRCKVYGCSFKSAAESYVNRGHLISNNYIADCGQTVGHGCGIYLTQSGHNELSHNVIRRMPRYGISYKGNRFGLLPKTMYGTKVSFENHFNFVHTRNIVIRYNDIGNVCRDSFDFGGIESWGVGRDNLWEANAVHDIDQAVEWDGWAHALFPDDGSHYVTLRGNIIYGCRGGKLTAAVMMKSVGELVENNIIADNVLGHPVCAEPWVSPAGEMVFRRNIVWGKTAKIYYVGSKTRKAVKQFDHNLIWPAHHAMAHYRRSGWDVHSIEADPMLELRKPFWDRTYKDYVPKTQSPAWKLGFKPIAVDRIGLKEDFPFDRRLLGRRSAAEKVQAENYDRIHRARTSGATCVYHIEPGAWLKYENVDFGSDKFRRFEAQLEYNKVPEGKGPRKAPAVELRLGSPKGRMIGRLLKGRTTCTVKRVEGVHTLYLVFPAAVVKRINWFVFKQDAGRGASGNR